MLIELDPVERITADAVGPPGERTFYLQARKGGHLVTILLEKQQVQLLAASVVEILSRIGKETGEGPPEEAMSLEEPILPEWRAGRLSIGYQEDRDLLLLEVEELLPGQIQEEEGEEVLPGLSIGPELLYPTEAEGEKGHADDEEEGPEAVGDEVDTLESLSALEAEQLEREPNLVRMWATREQMLSLARHGTAACARGRPRCRLCGNPIGPDGHVCAALNGHRGPGPE